MIICSTENRKTHHAQPEFALPKQKHTVLYQEQYTHSLTPKLAVSKEVTNLTDIDIVRPLEQKHLTEKVDTDCY